ATGLVFSIASWISRNIPHICCWAWATKAKKAASKKLHKNAVMAKGNKRRTTKRGLSWSSFRNSRPLWITAKTNVGSNKRSRSSFEGTTIASRFMFETTLVNRKFAKRPKYLQRDRKSTRLNSSHQIISYAVFCLKKKT